MKKLVHINLDKILFEKKIKVAQLSKETGISANTLYSWKNNHTTKIRLDYLEIICKTLDCEIKDLLIINK